MNLFPYTRNLFPPIGIYLPYVKVEFPGIGNQLASMVNYLLARVANLLKVGNPIQHFSFKKNSP